MANDENRNGVQGRFDEMERLERRAQERFAPCEVEIEAWVYEQVEGLPAPNFAKSVGSWLARRQDDIR